MKIKKGDKVKVDYEGSFDDGEIFDSSTHGDHSHPLEFEVGAGNLIKGFDEAVIGMKKNEEKEIVIKPEDGYGERNEKLVREVPRKNLPQDREPKIGMMVDIGLQDGKHIPVKIEKITKEKITLDLNHPLAGRTLHFKIKIVGIN